VSISADAAPAIVAGIFALVGAGYGSRHELKKVTVERFNERERDFERAQVGYRACYRKFLTNIAAFHADSPGEDGIKPSFATLLDNFWEASFTGDPGVIYQLEEYWPAANRANGDPPSKTPPEALLQAMRNHGSRSLSEEIEFRKKFNVAGLAARSQGEDGVRAQQGAAEDPAPAPAPAPNSEQNR
jgi:hypothetical protein